MKIAEPDPDLLARALEGDLDALDAVLSAIQGGVYNLAVRVLGNRDEAADATQEILLRVVTHLSGFRGESAFATWVFRVAHNQLATVRSRLRDAPVSLDALAEKLQSGLDFAVAAGIDAERALTPEEKVAARQVALSCTQSMLMALDHDDRVAYVLDVSFGLDSQQAGAVLGITAAAYRQRLARTRAKLKTFTQANCGLANKAAACRCERQLPALDRLQKSSSVPRAPVVALHRAEHQEAERAFASMVRMSDAAALFKAHPRYRAPQTLLDAIRQVLRSEGFDPATRRLQ